MENKINIAEILRNCPQGMELYSTIYGTVYFEGVRDTGNAVLIDVKTSCNTEAQFYPDGKFNTYYSDSEMTLFPSKDIRTWEGFVPPCEFKDGDILATDLGSVFYLNTRLNTDECYGCYVGIGGDGFFYICEPFAYKECCGFATEEEKAKLFKAIKANGYRWNAVTKTLERLIKPKFKVGDRIRHKCEKFRDKRTIISYGKSGYWTSTNDWIDYENQDNWELIPNKFDINTLVPFESRVLVRNSKDQYWIPAFWGYQTKDGYVTTFGHCNYCIPYEAHKELLGTTNNPKEYGSE